ncbi:MAG: single-stranded-DNA-specific exonuclease RecJ [bacterium]|nr:single-stranded-DNA-specific exonuclease RecJ [bacterium]
MKSYRVREKVNGDLLDHLLFYRGIRTQEEKENFLNPDYDKHTHDPFLLKDAEKAAERIIKAIENEEKTVIYSDYDTDGIPAGVALHDLFKKIGFKNFTNYIPHRHDEGFGLNEDAIRQFVEEKVQLLITIDCGIADLACVELAQKNGIDVIVTDHHLPGPTLPPAFAIVNPKQADCAYPEKMLCGAGVIYKLIQAILTKNRFGIKEGWEKWLLDMVGIATLSDMVPLKGENRVFAYYGLSVLRKSPRKGLMRLLNKLKVNQKYLTEEDIGFTIGPRINAASRMGVPMDAFRLLATQDDDEAEKFAIHLDHINNERKGTVAALVKEVKKHVHERYGEKPEKVIVIGNPSWRPSLLGLAANTCAEEYGVPVFLWGRDGDDIIKGSCRAAGSVHLLDLMQKTVDGTFMQYGGHAESGGFSVTAQAIHSLEKNLSEVFEKIRGEKKENIEYVDSEISPDDVNYDIYRVIEKLGPYGTGNPKPLFMLSNIVLDDVQRFGKEKNHLKLIIAKSDKKKVSAIGFFMNPDMFGKKLDKGLSVSLVVTMEKSLFGGRPELRLRIVDII